MVGQPTIRLTPRNDQGTAGGHGKSQCSSYPPKSCQLISFTSDPFSMKMAEQPSNSRQQ